VSIDHREKNGNVSLRLMPVAALSRTHLSRIINRGILTLLTLSYQTS
jgi:hypothetical protein